MKSFLIVLFLLMSLPALYSQDNSLIDNYEQFRERVSTRYQEFYQKANNEYAEFVKRAWKWYNEGVVIPKPREEMLPPIIIEDNSITIDDNPIIYDKVINTPEPQPQPVPPTPIRKNPTIDDSYVAVSLYGAECKVRFPALSIAINDLKPESLALAWEQLAKEDYNNTIRDCLENRIRYELSDWAYLKMIDLVCSQKFGTGTRESEMAKAYIFSQSGYAMRLAVANDKLIMLYGTPYIIYGKLGWEIDGLRYYCDYDNIDRIYICEASFPFEQPLSTSIIKQQHFPLSESLERPISNQCISVKSRVNKNHIDFCNNFPSSQYGDDPITRWAIYANTPTTKEMSETLYPQLRRKFDGLSNYDAVNALCNWIQTAFVYEYDDTLWGCDRAFFPDETLYYPYCDCEDRAILLTRIVRDLLGLDCALVYYPGHLAAAVALGEEAIGDYLRINGKKFLVCDPTYINAPIGLTMPGMDNSSANVII